MTFPNFHTIGRKCGKCGRPWNGVYKICNLCFLELIGELPKSVEIKFWTLTQKGKTLKAPEPTESSRWN